MQPQFFIESKDEGHIGAKALSLQIGKNYFGYSVLNTENNQLVELGWYHIQKLTLQQLNILLNNNNTLNENFDRIATAFDFATYSLLPVEHNSGDHSSLLYLNGAAQQDHIVYENVKNDITLVYSMPYEILNWCVKNFTSSSYWHLQTLRINNTSEHLRQGLLNVNIVNKSFHIVVTKDNELLLAQTYQYKTPADVLFYLLKICEMFSLSQTEVGLKLSGLVDKDSAIYKMLYDYFLNISFTEATWQIPENPYPAHYFTTLNEIALCASLQEN